MVGSDRFFVRGVLPQVRQFIDGAYQRTLGLLKEKKDFVEAMAQVRGGHLFALICFSDACSYHC
jgi:hypothetical protein